VIAYWLSVGVAFINAYAFLAVQGALAVYYAFDPISRRAAPRGQGEAVDKEGTDDSDLVGLLE
jgi:hypothetical protein